MKLKFYLRNLLATLVLVLIAGSAWAQSRRVTGIVYDTDGKTPMVGATILVKNTTNGVISGIDGSYTIEVPGDDATLISSPWATTRRRLRSAPAHAST